MKLVALGLYFQPRFYLAVLFLIGVSCSKNKKKGTMVEIMPM